MNSRFKLWPLVFVVLPACSDDGTSANTSAAHDSGGSQNASGSANVAGAEASGGDQNGSGSGGKRNSSSASGGNRNSSSGSGGKSSSGSGGDQNAAGAENAGGSSGSGGDQNGSGGDQNGSGGASGGSAGAGGVAGSSGGRGSGGRGSGGRGSGGRGSGGGNAAGGASGGSGSGSGGAAGSGSGGTSGSGSGGAPQTGSPTVRQWITFGIPQDPAQTHDRSVTFQKPVLAGSTILVLQAEAALAPPDGMKVDDSANVTYPLLDTFTDGEGVTKTFIRSNVSAGSLSVHAYFPETQWQTILAIEVAGVSANPVIGQGSAKTYVPGGTPNVVDGIRSPNISVSAASAGSPAIIVAFGVNLADYVGGQGAPVAGTGFKTEGTMFNWQGVEVTTNVDSSILESRLVTSAGQVSGNFTTKGSGFNEYFLSVAVVLR